MAKNFPNLLKNYNLHIQEVQQIPNIPNRIPRDLQTQQTKNAESQRQGRNLESSKRKMTHYLQINSSKINN